MFISSSPRSGSKAARVNNTSAIQHIPFSTNLSNLSLELGRTDSSLATSPVGSDVTSISGHSFRDDHQQKALEDENFKLKLRVYMLEERLQRQDSPQKSQIGSPNGQLATLKQELAQKQLLLQRASATLETLENQHHQQAQAHERTEAERTLLEHSLDEVEQQLAHQLDQQQREKEEATQLKERLEAEVASLKRRLSDTVQKHQRTEQERRRLQSALQQLRREHADQAAQHSRTGTEQPRQRDAKRAGPHNDDGGLKQKYLQSLDEENVQRSETLRICNKENEPDSNRNNDNNNTTHNCAPDECAARREADALRLQLSAAAIQRRRAQAVAASALQLQTERARSLQRSVQNLSEQLQRAQAQLDEVAAQRGREAEPTAIVASQHATSTDVEVIAEEEMPELVAAVDEDLSQPRQAASSRQSSLRPVAESTPKRPTTLRLSPAATPSLNLSRASSERRGRGEPVAARDGEECDSWSEPDLDVSQARIGLGRSSLEPPQRPRCGATYESDASSGASGGGDRPRPASEAQHLHQRVEALQQLRESLRAEVAIYQQMLPPGGDQEKLQAVASVPPRLLEDIGQLREQLVSAISRHQETERRHSRSAAPPQELTLALTITQEALTKSTQKLADMQQRNQKLRVKLQRIKDNMQQTELDKNEIRGECNGILDNMRLMQENMIKLEAENQQLQQQRTAERQLRQQLQRADERQSDLEQLVRQLTQQLRQVAPAAAAATDSCAAEERVRRAEQQLLQLGRQRLKLLGESARMRSKCRLLRSEAAVQHNRNQLETLATSPEADDGATSAAWSWPREREELEHQLKESREAEDRLQAEHEGCETRRRQDQHQIAGLSYQLQMMKIHVEELQVKAAHYEDAGQSCPESTRSCELPVAPPHGSNSGSDTFEFLKRSRAAVYSSPDLGIESDSQRCASRTSHSTALSHQALSAECGPVALRTRTHPAPPDAVPEADDTPVGARTNNKLAETEAALRKALQQLERTEQRRERFESAVYREIGKTELMVARARGNIPAQAMRLSAGEAMYE